MTTKISKEPIEIEDEVKEDFQILNPSLSNGARWSIIIIALLVLILVLYLLWSKLNKRSTINLKPDYYH